MGSTWCDPSEKTFLWKTYWSTNIFLLQEIVCVKKVKRFVPQKTRKYLAEFPIISKIDYGNIIYSNASQNSVIRLQKLLKVTCCFVNGPYSNSLDVILLIWLPISERIDFSIINLTHRAFTPCPSYLKLSFKKLSRYLRKKDEFLITMIKIATLSLKKHVLFLTIYLIKYN